MDCLANVQPAARQDDSYISALEYPWRGSSEDLQSARLGTPILPASRGVHPNCCEVTRAMPWRVVLAYHRTIKRQPDINTLCPVFIAARMMMIFRGSEGPRYARVLKSSLLPTSASIHHEQALIAFDIHMKVIGRKPSLTLDVRGM